MFDQFTRKVPFIHLLLLFLKHNKVVLTNKFYTIIILAIKKDVAITIRKIVLTIIIITNKTNICNYNIICRDKL